MSLKEKVVAIAHSCGVNTQDHGDLSKVLRTFGDELRSGRLRHELGQSDLPVLCMHALNETDAEVQIEAIRVIANLCIDHSAFFSLIYQMKTGSQ